MWQQHVFTFDNLFFFLPSHSPLPGFSTLSSFTHPRWIFGLLPGLALMFNQYQTFLYTSLCGHYLSLLYGKCPRVGSLGKIGVTFIRNCQFSRVVPLCPPQQCLRVPVLRTCQHLWRCSDI